MKKENSDEIIVKFEEVTKQYGDLVRSRGLGDVYKRQLLDHLGQEKQLF